MILKDCSIITAKYVEGTDVMRAVTGRCKSLLCGAFGGFLIIQPLMIPLSTFFVRWSPAMLPYYAFGASAYELMKLEEEGSLLYWSVLIIDWTVLSAATLASVCIIVVVTDALLLIIVILTAMRSVIHSTQAKNRRA